jgi:hypothetical protein
MVNKNKNHDAGCAMQDVGCENVRSPMFTGGVTRLVQCGMKRSGNPLRQDGEAKFEDLRLKMRFHHKTQ